MQTADSTGAERHSAILALRLHTNFKPLLHRIEEEVISVAGLSQTASPNPYLRASSLQELLNWSDVDFVRCAFVTTLGRQPDPTGEAYYLHRLRAGYSKLKILSQLRNSFEGARHDPGIAGFDRALRRARWERSIFGWAVRPFTGGESDSPSWRRHRELINELRRQNDDTRPPGNGPELAGHLASIANQIGSLTETIGRISVGVTPIENQTSPHLQYLDSPDFNNLSESAKNIFQRVHAYSH